MQQRRRYQPEAEPLYNRLADEAERLRKQARGTPPGIERERLIRRARQIETASHISEWLSSPGLRAPT
ncbi:hypothetical protein SAMN05444164_2004 [Bradyrhizobium erythrophlei]|uniref:Uncharacterized protein n=1 Tax=Bradyrhizobium erythrophlei TaxID=1437360 RepID=A0A1H4T2L1_9BRAD|nr:hypothetical protein [Bradyrhizobium erythrophlei]SEC50550.1 hypothetical protein SAMN05444164_2004 [Bradyrhizobium erythrophlei]